MFDPIDMGLKWMRDLLAQHRVETMATACHSAWYAYAVIGLGEVGEPWDTAPDWQKNSIRNAVKFWDECLAAYLDSIKEDLGQPTSTEWARSTLPEKSHENWLKHKHETGWIYGSIKDETKKTHPCMVPYEELPEAQRKKDRVVLETYLALRTLL